MISLFSFLVLATSASLSFNPIYKPLPVGDEFGLTINVSTASRETIGTDAVILYDPKMLEATKILPAKAYPNYPPNLVDIDNVHGKVQFSGTVGFGQPKTAEGVLGKVFFRPKKVGTTSVNFAWEKGGTADSNIVPNFGGLDLLTEAPPPVTLSFREATREEKILFLIKRIFSFDYLRF